DEHHSVHAVQHAHGLGTSRRALESRQGHHGQGFDSSRGDFVGSVRTERRRSLRRSLSIRHRDGRNLHPGGNDLGQLLRTYLPRNHPRYGLATYQCLLRRWTALFRRSFRLHPELLSLVHYLHRHVVRLGFAKPLSPPAEKIKLTQLSLCHDDHQLCLGKPGPRIITLSVLTEPSRRP